MKDEKEKLFFVWNGIDGELEEFETIEKAQKYITDAFENEEEGIHPDIESVFIMKKILNTEVEIVEQLNSGLGEPTYHKIVFKETT